MLLVDLWLMLMTNHFKSLMIACKIEKNMTIDYAQCVRVWRKSSLGMEVVMVRFWTDIKLLLSRDGLVGEWLLLANKVASSNPLMISFFLSNEICLLQNTCRQGKTIKPCFQFVLLILVIIKIVLKNIRSLFKKEPTPQGSNPGLTNPKCAW